MAPTLLMSLAALLLPAITLVAQDGGQDTTIPDEPDNPAPVNQSTEPETVLLKQTMDGTQYAADITLMDGVKPLFPLRSELTPWDPFAPTPTPVNQPKLDPLLPDPLEIFMRPIRNSEAWTQDNLGISWNVYYTLLYQYASRTVNDPTTNEPYGRNAGTGRLDLGINWDIFDIPDTAHGQIGLLMRSGVVIGQPDTYRAGTAVGSIPVSPDALYWGDQTSLCLAYWQQGFCNDQLVITAGKIHPNQYMALSRIANDETTQFISGVFDGLNTLGPSLGNYAPGVALQFVPDDGFYFNAVLLDAEGGPNTGFNSVGNGNWWMGGQFGFVPKFRNADGDELVGNWAIMFAATNYGVVESNNGRLLTTLGPGVIPPAPPVLPINTQLALNPIILGAGVNPSSDADGHGFGVLIEQQLTPDITVLAEYGLSNPNLSTIEEAVNLVAAHTSPFGRKDDMIGVGLNWSVPSSMYITDRREEIFMEMFYRLQITASMQLTPDLQILFRPSTGESRPIAIFGLRLRTQF